MHHDSLRLLLCPKGKYTTVLLHINALCLWYSQKGLQQNQEQQIKMYGGPWRFLNKKKKKSLTSVGCIPISPKDNPSTWKNGAAPLLCPWRAPCITPRHACLHTGPGTGGIYPLQTWDAERARWVKHQTTIWRPGQIASLRIYGIQLGITGARRERTEQPG